MCSKAAYTTCFSLQTWNNDDNYYYDGWNPGNMDADVSDEIVASLEAAPDGYPRESAERANILRNFEYYQAVQHRMKASHYNNLWQGMPPWGPRPLVPSSRFPINFKLFEYQCYQYESQCDDCLFCRIGGSLGSDSRVRRIA